MFPIKQYIAVLYVLHLDRESDQAFNYPRGRVAAGLATRSKRVIRYQSPRCVHACCMLHAISVSCPTTCTFSASCIPSVLH